MEGRFKKFSGQFTWDEKNLSVEAEVETASVETGQEERDQHLRSADDKPQAILVYKSSATVLETLLVPAGLESFTQTLGGGARLDEAITGFLESSADDSSIAMLPDFIAHLQSTSAWENFL